LDCSCSKINDELSYALFTYDYYAADYFFSLHNYFSFITVSVCVGIIFHLINNKVYALPIVGLHDLPNSPRIRNAGLQAHISRRSVYIHIV